MTRTALQQPAIDSMTLRRVCGRFCTGITVVTSRDLDGTPRGFTANSFTSVSLDPPLILVCVDVKADTLPALHERRAFAVNFLASDGEHLSRRFATKGGDKFDGAKWREGILGVPLLDDCIAHLECEVENIYPGGDHLIVVGQVVDLDQREGEPLLFYSGTYRHLGHTH